MSEAKQPAGTPTRLGEPVVSRASASTTGLASAVGILRGDLRRPDILDLYYTDRSYRSHHSSRGPILGITAMSLSEIEKAALRLVALRSSANMSNAAGRLGMAPVSLARWAA